MKLFRGHKVVLENGSIQPACIVVDGETISKISLGYDSENPDKFEEKTFVSTRPLKQTARRVEVAEQIAKIYKLVVDAGSLLLMSGVVDCHVHVNEPGRTEWEGYDTATRAAAAGGVTTIVDMPLNSVPSTTSVEALSEKLASTDGKLHVDVGFWGGVVPGNQSSLVAMLDGGVLGFKCFMIDSGVDEFQHSLEQDIRRALDVLQATNGVLLFHAELEVEIEDIKGESQIMKVLEENKTGDPKKYDTFLRSRPDEMEIKAIKLVCQLCTEYRVPCHIVHLSTAQALPVIERCKQSGAPLTVETTHHYLNLAAEHIPDGATEYKCVPPIRSQANQDLLWQGVNSGLIDMIVSDHSPCTDDLKLREQGDFFKAWGGIASVQFGLSISWTGALSHGVSVSQLSRLLSLAPAQLAGISDRKGSIAVGRHADFVIWDPDESFTLTPYRGQTLRGVVHRTVVRGHTVYNEGHFFLKQGKTLLGRQSK